jgi:hypothetical protein
MSILSVSRKLMSGKYTDPTQSHEVLSDISKRKAMLCWLDPQTCEALKALTLCRNSYMTTLHMEPISKPGLNGQRYAEILPEQ